jgi:hypothetical protein
MKLINVKNFSECKNIEENFYNEFFKKWLLNKGYNPIWVYYDENNLTYKELQKKNDIDVIIDDGYKNISLSLKTVKAIYNDIFFETVSNCNKGTPGWGFYSKADYIIYTMGYATKNYKIYKFKISDILDQLNIEDYPKRYVSTENKYKTEGRKIPLTAFKNKLIYPIEDQQYLPGVKNEMV